MAPKRNFNDWFKNFKSTINSYDYYVNFEKVYFNVEAIKISLNLMNSLIGSKKIEEDFEALMTRYPEIITCIPILIAVRLKDIGKNGLEILDDGTPMIYNFNKKTNTSDEYKKFMYKTGLFELLSNHLINNLVDYVTGVETGMDSNGRKNRGGKNMEALVESYIKATGCKYYTEMQIAEVEKKYKLDLSALSNNGKTVKRFDFIVESEGHVYGFEVNFYASGGSKLNETARSYKMLAEEAKNINGFSLVWITDGAGWQSARNNLEETFDIFDNVYCIDDLDKGVLNQLFNNKIF